MDAIKIVVLFCFKFFKYTFCIAYHWKQKAGEKTITEIGCFSIYLNLYLCLFLLFLKCVSSVIV